MKKNLFRIYDTLALHRLVTLTALVVSGLVSGLSVWFHFKTQQELRNTSYVIDPSGGIIPIRLSANSDQFEVEVRSHIQRFLELFYGLEPSGMQANLTKALWLADQSVDELYRQKKMEGVYNRILQYALIHKVNQVTIALHQDKGGVTFVADLDFEVSRGTSKDAYHLQVRGAIKQVQRNFPNNPHGLLITDYYEQSLKKMQHETIQK